MVFMSLGVYEIYAQEPAVKWNTYEHDFGTVSFRDTLKFDFTYQNISRDTLTLTGVVVSCHCVKPDWNLGKVLAPGDRDTISTLIKPKGAGPFSRIIRVGFEGADSPEQLILKGTVKSGR